MASRTPVPIRSRSVRTACASPPAAGTLGPVPRSTARAFSLIAFGVTLFLGALGGQYAQDAVAPWWNLAETRMRSPLTFVADGGRYRVITSGVSRPALERVGCTIRTADGGSLRRLGGSGAVNPREALGVSRVLEFRAPKGRTAMVCADRISRTSTFGRYQVVAADSLLSKAIVVSLVLGVVCFLTGGLLVWRAHGRAAGDDDGPGLGGPGLGGAGLGGPGLGGAGWSAFGDRDDGAGGSEPRASAGGTVRRGEPGDTTPPSSAGEPPSAG